MRVLYCCMPGYVLASTLLMALRFGSSFISSSLDMANTIGQFTSEEEVQYTAVKRLVQKVGDSCRTYSSLGKMQDGMDLKIFK